VTVTSRRTVVLAHPSPDLYGSDRMLIESVRAVTADSHVVVALPCDGPLVDHLVHAGAEVAILPFPVLRKSLLSARGIIGLAIATCRALPRLVRLIRGRRAEAVYVNTVTIPIWLMAARIARTPAICHVHEAEEGVSRSLAWLLALPLRLAGSIVANSHASRLALANAGLRRGERVQVVYNGVEGPAEVVPLRAERPGRLVVVSRLSPRKRTDVAIDATLRLREQGFPVSLTLVGGVFPGYEWFEEELRRMAAGSLAISFAGIHDSVWWALAEADIALVPSRWEPFGNVAVEAMLAGRPVVASDVQGLKEIIRDGETGLLVRAGDPGALAAAVSSLLVDWPRAMRLAEAGREDALNRFDRRRYQAEIRGVVNNVAGCGTMNSRPTLAEMPD
jgi:glycosyltransferase involved in cell wall biosynthesis